MQLRMSLLTVALSLSLSLAGTAQDASAQPELAPGAKAITSEGVNLRSGPGTKHDRIKVIPEDATVEVQE